MTQAYVYKWTHTPSLRWYVGSRTRQGCHPNDGYICSSRTVKPLIQAKPEEWTRTIIATGTPEDMLELETQILTAVNAKHDLRSYNGHNNDGKGFVTAGRPKSEEHKAKLRAWNIGRKLTAETRELMSQVRMGRIHNRITCPHCGKVGGDNNMYRYHFGKCKSFGNPTGPIEKGNHDNDNTGHA